MLDRLDAIDAAMREIDPSWPLVSDVARAAIHAEFDGHPMTDEQRVKIARVLRAEPGWRELLS